VEEAIRRGKLYLEAGATTAFILSSKPDGVTREEVEKMVRELDGRVNVGLRLARPGMASTALTVPELAELGVARVSVGPQLFLAAAEAMKYVGEKVFGSATTT
jgi:2-methylisocitrate lyase-like PEP mutase family enzyme